MRCVAIRNGLGCGRGDLPFTNNAVAQGISGVVGLIDQCHQLGMPGHSPIQCASPLTIRPPTAAIAPDKAASPAARAVTRGSERCGFPL